MVNSVRLNTLINFYLIFPFYFVYTTLIVYLNRKLLKIKRLKVEQIIMKKHYILHVSTMHDYAILMVRLD